MTNQKVIILKGLPASGKTTYALQLVDKLGYKRVNKDDLRSMIDNSKWSKEREKIIFNLEKNMVLTFLDEGHNVVIDDTNYAKEQEWFEFLSDLSEWDVKTPDIEVVDFSHISPRVCIERDIARGSKVGAKVILGMYNKYVRPNKKDIDNTAKQQAFIFDIDGTLAHMDGRSPYDYSKVSTDKPDTHVATLLRKLQNAGNKIIIVSGRKDDCLNETKQWMNNYISQDYLLFMRESEDNRSDDIVKKEIYEKYIEPQYNVIGVFDDRDRVVDMWRSLGLTCYQVASGNF